MLSEAEKKLADKLWFTFKARIRAQERLSRNDLHSQLLLVWYALLSAVLSIVAIRYPKVLGENTDIAAAILAIALLIISLLVTNRDFKGRSIAMRQNYLDIQGLHNELTIYDESKKSLEDISERYKKILRETENHSGIDDKYFRTFHKNSTRPVSCSEMAQVWIYLCVRGLVLTALYLGPGIVILLKSNCQLGG